MTRELKVRIVQATGSSPRDTGTQMFVSDNTQFGTIGGGRLEWQAIDHARAILNGAAEPGDVQVTLGPAIGQCCGGTVTLSFEFSNRSESEFAPVLIFGGGHVGAALFASLKPHFPQVEVFDTRSGYGTHTPIPEAHVRGAPAGAAFAIATHDHGLDFLIAQEALARKDAAYVGMIGSATKRKVLERQLREAGVDAGSLVCPIGASGLGDKRPEIIALHTAAEILQAITK